MPTMQHMLNVDVPGFATNFEILWDLNLICSIFLSKLRLARFTLTSFMMHLFSTQDVLVNSSPMRGKLLH